LATTSGTLHSTNKSILTQQVQTPANVTVNKPIAACSLMAKHWWWSLESHRTSKHLVTHANKFANTVFKYQRIDVVLDRY